MASHRRKFIPTLSGYPASYGMSIPYGLGLTNVDSEDRSTIYLRLNSKSQVGFLPVFRMSFGFKEVPEELILASEPRKVGSLFVCVLCEMTLIHPSLSHPHHDLKCLS